MQLSAALRSEFTKTTRARGEHYAQTGRVAIISGSAHEVTATARGTDRYDVTLTRTDDPRRGDFQGSCTCPYAFDEGMPCKHLWATVVLAENAGHLTAGPPLDHPVTLEVIDPPGEDGRRAIEEDFDEFEGEEDEEVPRNDWRLPGRTRAQIRQAWAARRRQAPAQQANAQAAQFLNDLRGRLNAAGASPASPFATGELMYVVNTEASRSQNALVLGLTHRTQKTDGSWTQPKAANVGPSHVAGAPDADRRILSLLVGAADARYPSYYGASGEIAMSGFTVSELLIGELLPAIAATGRAWVRDDGGELLPVTWDDGPPWEFQPEVAETAKGYGVGGVFRRAEATMAVGEPLLVLRAGFLVTRSHVARLSAGQAPLLFTLRTRGFVDVPILHSDALAETLALAGVDRDRLPEPLRFQEIDEPPRPKLAISGQQRGYSTRFEATVSFDYGGASVPPDGRRTAIDVEGRRLVRRRPDVEAAWLSRLPALGLRPQFVGGSAAIFAVPVKAMLPAIQTLIDEGWLVEGNGRPYRLPGAVSLSVTSGVDWFDLEATVEYGSSSVAVTAILAALQRGQSAVVLDDGSVGVVPEDWMRRYGPLAATGEVHDGRLRFRRTQAALLDALLEQQAADTAQSVDATFDRVRRELASFAGIAPADPPGSLVGTLRDYQRAGLGWLQFLRRFGFGGCLADDMGLGKTIMVLALLAWWREERTRLNEPARPSLIVVPRSLIYNWKNEAARFTPHLIVIDHSDPKRGARAADLAAADVVLVTYGTVRRDALKLQPIDFEYVILDEAQAVKNAATVSAKATRLLRGRHRLALTGTPIENHLGELWSLFDFLNPGVLGRSAVFQRAAAAAAPGAETTALVARGLRPFILRRTKAEVARELPARTEQTIMCNLSKAERDLYDGLRRHYRERLLGRVARVGLARSKIQVLEALLRLRQAACHPGLLERGRGVGGGGSAKFDVLLPRLREVIEEGHKALVFSQFTTLLGLLRKELDASALRYEYLDGRTRDRQARVERFQGDPECPIFLISLKAGGVGLNLTAAEYVFLLDPWWNPAVEAQAMDRAHRIGQTREVFAYRLIARDTVEEKVLALQQSKRALADAVLGTSAVGLRDLHAEDLELLLS